MSKKKTSVKWVKTNVKRLLTSGKREGGGGNCMQGGGGLISSTQFVWLKFGGPNCNHTSPLELNQCPMTNEIIQGPKIMLKSIIK